MVTQFRADVAAKTLQSKTALHMAVRNRDIKIAELLIKNAGKKNRKEVNLYKKGRLGKKVYVLLIQVGTKTVLTVRLFFPA